ncbi:MAG: septum site-determining protein MinD [Caldilineaceae bacterium]|nr:septum site-determining protein MinD [Caldilineaceae bacterium]HRJ40581.1 septum site-determining protein MinD [Caldilineaceae bacterium]
MAGVVLTITSGKGGVGKTTTSANLGTALAMAGQRVVVVDADLGLRNLDIIMGLESRIVYNVVDVIEERCPLHQALVKDKRVDELYLLPASQTRDKTAITPDQMMSVCQELQQIADYVLIDSPAGIESGFRNAVAPATEVLIVTTPEVSALRDADKVIYLLERDVGIAPRLVINRYNPRLVRRRDMLSSQDILDILSIDLIGIVPDDDSIVISTNKGRPVALDREIYVSQAYHNIAQRILGYNVPLMRFQEIGWRERLRRAFGL